MLVIGVDGGGTRTRVALTSSDGSPLGVGESGSGNLQDVGPAEVALHIDAARDQAFREARLDPGPVDAAFLGMAGAATPSVRASLCEIARDLRLARTVDAGTDLRIALMGGLGGRPGIVLIAGTGSSCYGRRDDGRSWRAGGFGSYLDDGGGATDLGRRALAACVRAADGRGAATALTDRVLPRLDVADVHEIPLRVERMSRAEVAGLAPEVTAAADAGDAVARDILRAAAEELALLARTVAAHLELTDPEIVLVGGLVRSPGPFRETVVRSVLRALPGARPREPEQPPEVGAALCALELLRPDAP